MSEKKKKEFIISNNSCTMNKLPYTFSVIFFGIISISATYIGLAYFYLGLWGRRLTARSSQPAVRSPNEGSQRQ